MIAFEIKSVSFNAKSQPRWIADQRGYSISRLGNVSGILSWNLAVSEISVMTFVTNGLGQYSAVLNTLSQEN